MEQRLLRETEEKLRLRSDGLMMTDELQKLRLLKIEPKREHFGTVSTALERDMMRSGKLIDPLKQSEYKSYLKGSKVISSQNSSSNHKISKHSTFNQPLKQAPSVLSDKYGPSSNRHGQTFDRSNFTDRELHLDGSFEKTPTKYATKPLPRSSTSCTAHTGQYVAKKPSPGKTMADFHPP
jgi:hypothetical protein